MQPYKLIALFCAFFAAIQLNNVAAQVQPTRATIPNFWDSAVRISKPDNLKLTRLRFLTTTDFPPFNFIDRNKRLSGLHVDIARHICNELDILRLCQMQAIPWDTLTTAIEKGEGEAVVAGIQKTVETEKRYDFSEPFLRIPGRFIALRASNIAEPMANSLYQKQTGLVTNSAHAKYFQAVFANRKYKTYDTLQQARQALIAGEIDTLFSDAVSLAFWLSSKAATNCCKFVGGPYLSQEYFGNGLRIAVPKGNGELVEALNFALQRINSNGTFRELYLRYFPMGLY